MSDPEDDQPVHIQINNDSDSDSGDDNEGVRIQINHDSSSDDDEPNANDAASAQNAAAPAQAASNNNNSHENGANTDGQGGDIAVADNADPEPWDDSVLDKVQSRDRISVTPEELKLMKLRAKHQQDPDEAAPEKPVIPTPTVTSPATSSPARVPDRRLTPSKQEEKRDMTAQNSLFGLSVISPTSPPANTLNSPPASAPSVQPQGTSPKPKQNPFTIRTKLIARTLINIDLTNIKSIDDIEDALSYLHPDSTPYEGLVILPPIVNDPEPQPQQVEPTATETKPEQGESNDNDTEKTEPTEQTSSSSDLAAVAVAATVVVPVPQSNPAEDKKAKEEEEKKRKEEEKKAAEEQAKAAKKAKEDEKKAKEDEKKAAEEEAKRKKEEEKKRKEEEKKQAEEDAKKKKEEEKKRKEDEKKAKEEEAKRKKEEEKRKKEEEKAAKKNKGKAAVVAPVAVGAAVAASPSVQAEPSTNSTPEDDKPEPSVSKGSNASRNDNDLEPSVSRSGEVSSAVRLGGPNAPCAIPYHDADFPQPITFEQATEILKSQKPYKIASKFQKANVFGTSGFKKPDHQVCYFYQYLWDTDFDPTNRGHVLLLNAFYMYMNDLVIIPNHNADPNNKDNQRPEHCEVPELTGPHWATLRVPNTDEPWSDLQGVPARYTILRALEQDLKPSILPLYLALYLLQGHPNTAFKKVVVALLRQFFFRDNATSTMSYLEIFTPLGYVINSLIMSNTTVHAEPFYRIYYKCNLKKEFGQWIPFEDYSLNGFLLAVTEYMFVLPATFWFRHLIQQYDYPTLVCAVRQRLLSGMKTEFDRIDVEYCKGGYASYHNEIINDNYLAQDLKVVFAEQKKQKHLLTPLEAQIHMNQQQRGPGRNSISYTAPSPTPANAEENKGQTKIGPNIVVGKQGGADAPASPTAAAGAEKPRQPPPVRTAAMNMMAQLNKQKQAAKKDGDVSEDGAKEEDEGETEATGEAQATEAETQPEAEEHHPSDDEVEFKNDASDSDDKEDDKDTEQQ